MTARPDAAIAALEAHTQATDGKTLADYVDNAEGAMFPALDDLLADLLHLVGDYRLLGALERALVHWNSERSDDGAAA